MPGRPTNPNPNLDHRRGRGYWACSRCGWGIFCSPVRMYRESYCTTLGIGVGRVIRVSKMLRFMVKFYCDGQGAVRIAILYPDRSCFSTLSYYFLSPL